MKQAGAIILLVIVMAQTFSKCWLVVNFAINQRAIAATLCENRAKPNSDCHGKCYLRKQMTAQDKQESTPMNGGGKEKFEVFLFNEVAEEESVELYTEISTRFSGYAAHIIQQDAAAIFHPPQA